jgi:hypothetical protein
MSSFDLNQYCANRFDFRTSEPPRQSLYFDPLCAQFRPAVPKIWSLGDGDTPFYFRAISQDPLHQSLSFFDAEPYSIVPFQRARNRSNRTIFRQESTSPTSPSSSHSTPESQPHISVNFPSFSIVQHSFRIYSSSSFSWCRRFSSALSSSCSASSSLSALVPQHHQNISLLIFFPFQRVFLGCFSSIYYIYHSLFASFAIPCILVIVNPTSAIFSPSCWNSKNGLRLD